ncbi:DUF2613 family protein [Actinokineospora sp. HUAS TT18]|uniref:DUF2613 family protein n=1 Tax=Actinokineospora sp. HUAS TT18 TaxID=3447451 RepID=UPI003F51DFF2
MGKIVAALVAVLAGLGLATGVTFGVTSAASPDAPSKLDLNERPAGNGANGVVNYGTSAP